MKKKKVTISKRVKFQIEYCLFLSSRFIIRLLPLKFAHFFAKILSIIVYSLDHKHTQRAIQHLLHAGVAKNKKEAKKITFQNFVSMGKILLELVKFDQFMTPENIHEYITWDADQKAMDALKNPKGLIYVGAHFGNWEISGVGSSILVRPIVSVMRPFDNPKIGKFFRAKRSMFKQELCSKKSAVRPILNAIKNKKAVGILSDQHASKEEGVETVFFGHPARTHASAAYLHIKTGVPMVLGVARRLDDNFHFEYIIRGPFEVEPSGDIQKDVQRLTQMFTTELEKIIVKYPGQWIWSHRRWLDINREKTPEKLERERLKAERLALKRKRQATGIENA